LLLGVAVGAVRASCQTRVETHVHIAVGIKSSPIEDKLDKEYQQEICGAHNASKRSIHPKMPVRAARRPNS
jgi:hypothetical protein